jgi:hypothetical protein
MSEPEVSIHPALQELYALAPPYALLLHGWVQRWIVQVEAEEVEAAREVALEPRAREWIAKNLGYRLASLLVESGTVAESRAWSNVLWGDMVRFQLRRLLIREEPKAP